MKTTPVDAHETLDRALHQLELWNELLDRKWNAAVQRHGNAKRQILCEAAEQAVGSDRALLQALHTEAVHQLSRCPPKQSWTELLRPSTDYLAQRSQRVFFKL